jgi:hypothetical protein
MARWHCNTGPQMHQFDSLRELLPLCLSGRKSSRYGKQLPGPFPAQIRRKFGAIS